MTKLNEMKHFLTLVALLVSTMSLAQFTPYNPDADNDQFVGAQDLLAFLPLFGEDWNLDSLAVYHESDLMLAECCDGFFQLPQDADIVIIDGSYPEERAFVLPVIAKPIILLGANHANLGVENWVNQNNETETSPVFYASGLHPRAHLLIAAFGEYYLVD